MSKEEGLSVTQVLTDLYKEMDPIVEKISTKARATCRKGCAHCCYLLAIATLPEGMLIAERLLSKDWKDWLPRLRAAALETCFEGIDKASYFSKGLPCVFLGTGNLCQVYTDRPSACRYHYVVSPPENCSHHAPIETQTGMLDTIRFEEIVWQLSATYSRAVGLPPFLGAPIPLMVLYALQFIKKDEPEAYALITKACEGIPDPVQWLKLYMPGLIEESREEKASP